MCVPGALAASDIEHRLDRTMQKVFGGGDRQRHLSTYFTLLVDPVHTAPVPLLEILAVVLFGQKTRYGNVRFGLNSPDSMYSAGILWNSVTPRRASSSADMLSARMRPSISPVRPSSSHPVQISVSVYGRSEIF